MSPRGAHGRSRLGPVRIDLVVLGLVLALLTLGLLAAAGAGRPMSLIDEHIHLDTQFKVHHHTFPHRGSLMGPEVIHEWACGVGHEGGPTKVPCGSPKLGPAALPSGKYTTGYIHYPTWFIGGELYRTAYTAVFGERRPIDIYRQYAAFVLLVGVLCCAAAGWWLRLRGAALVAGTFTPVAASSIMMFGTQVNPNSAAVLCGALIGGAGLWWLRTGQGFWGLALATAFASVVSVISSLPVGAFLLAMLVVLVLRRRGWVVPGPWQPRWWQAGLLAALVLLPVYVYGRVVAAHATISNETLYGFAAVRKPSDVVVGAFQELFTLHDPWFEANTLLAPPGHLVPALLRTPAYGMPLVVSVIVLGALLWAAVERGRRADAMVPQTPTAERVLSVHRIMVWSALAGLVLYPPALRIWNAVTAGFDYEIVPRYSIAFAPLLTWLALATLGEGSRMARVLAAVSVAAVVALSVTGF